MLYVISIGAFQALMAVLLLWRNRFRNKADGLLIVLLCCIATHLAIKFYIFSFVEDMQIRTQMNTFIGLCYGPLGYLYVLKLLDDKFIPATRMYLFIPFVVAAIGYMTVFSLLVADAEVGHRALQLYNDSSTWVLTASGLVYPLLMLQKLRLVRAKEERQLVLHISVLMLVIATISLFFLSVGQFRSLSPEWNLLCRNVVYALLSIICIEILRFKYAGVAGVRQAPPPAPVSETVIPVAVPAEEAPRKVQLSETAHIKILQRLDKHLSATQLYLDPDLSLDKLAAAIGESKYHVSEALNMSAGKSFYQYINEYRITRAVEIMTSIQQKNLPVNILMIAFECGFKAKSSFNTYFKKITGETPSAYLSRLKTGTAAMY